MTDKLTIKTKEGKREFELLINPNCEFIDEIIDNAISKFIKEIKDQPKVTREGESGELNSMGIEKPDSKSEKVIPFVHSIETPSPEKKKEFPIVFENEKFVITLLKRSMLITEKIELNQVCFFYKDDFDLLIKAIDTWKEIKINAI